MIHRKPIPKKNFTVFDNDTIYNPNLSGVAKAILLYMLTRNDDWQFYESEIKSHFTNGKLAINTGIKELIDKGYIVRTKIKNPKGKYIYIYDIYEDISLNSDYIINNSETNSEDNLTDENTESDKTDDNNNNWGDNIINMFNTPRK